MQLQQTPTDCEIKTIKESKGNKAECIIRVLMQILLNAPTNEATFVMLL